MVATDKTVKLGGLKKRMIGTIKAAAKSSGIAHTCDWLISEGYASDASHARELVDASLNSQDIHTTLKVFGGLTFNKGKQRRTAIAARSKKAAVDALGVSPSYFREYWMETGNDDELKLALSQPGTVFIEMTPYSGNFQPLSE